LIHFYKSVDFQMIVPLLLAIVFLITSAQVNGQEGLDPVTRSNRIAGGKEAKPHSIPYQAYVRICWKNDCYPCGGTLINKRYVMTAMHCVKEGGKTANDVKVALGGHDTRDRDRNIQIIPVEDIIERWDYNEKSNDNDIALLRLAKDAEFNAYVQPANLPKDKGETFNKRRAVVSGWGDVNAKGKKSYVLKKAYLKIRRKCGSKLFICANAPDNSDSCFGDSGGPLVVKEKGRITVVGVVSHGDEDCNGTSYYTRVTHYLDWIKRNIQRKRI